MSYTESSKANTTACSDTLPTYQAVLRAFARAVLSTFNTLPPRTTWILPHFIIQVSDQTSPQRTFSDHRI